MALTMKCISPLEKVFYDDMPRAFRSYPTSTALIGERHSFCVLYRRDNMMQHSYDSSDCPMIVETDLPAGSYVVNRIEHAPSVFPAARFDDPDDYLRVMPGLYPDILIPTEKDEVLRVLPGISNTLWVDVYTEKVPKGSYTFTLSLTNGSEVIGSVTHKLRVIGAVLPEQKAAVTHWFHSDCLADYYHVKVFSRDWWRIVENFVRTAVENGTNMLYTPLFTPPLDTKVGGERTTVQLVGVECAKGKYSFDFTKLEQWVAMCKKCGVKFYEMSHLFTQWGAKHAPKIYVTEDGKLIKKFGWDTDAAGKEYEAFLSSLLPALVEKLKELGIFEVSYFHISDEPSTEHFEGYKKCSDIIHKYLNSPRIMDAMGDVRYYDEHLCDVPVPFIEHADKFFERNIRPRWMYYCGAPKNHTSRNFGMPSSRNRILGMQMYRYEVDGFLQWGFNFYNSQCSLRHIDPFYVTDADKRFCSGDSYLVYPAPDGTAYHSIRLAVLKHGFDDLRALQLCESLAGREAVEAILTECNGGKPLELHQLPEDKNYTLNVRKKVNALIESLTR